MAELYGYTGRILRINLTESSTQIVSTTNYVPEYLGGLAVGTKIFWDEVQAGVKAFDPENKLIFMTGAACGTGMPASNRMSVSGISPNSLPEQFCHSNMGGFFSGMLKFAGYDGLIVEGKAPVHTYVYIDEDNVEFLPADGFIWGEFVHETQDKIFEKHGKHAHAVVIGPAGEHLHRNASITNSNDSAAAKAGFGAVMGSKNLKAIVVHGNREVPVADSMRVMELHKSVGYPVKAPNPMTRRTVYGGAKMTVDVPEGFDNARLCCGFGCNVVCMNTIFDAPNPVDGPEKVAQVIKCVDIAACNMTYDVVRGDWNNIHSRRNENPRGETYDQMCANTSFQGAPLPPSQGSYQYNKLRVNDPNNPELPEILTCYTGDKLNYFGPSFERGTTISVLCTQYGLDKWDVIVWYFSWLAMAQQEGILNDLDFGMKVDVDNVEFVKHFMHMMVYREGKLGNIFAEGMARAMRILGKEKYGDAIYHNRYDMEGKKQLDLPCSIEAGWGHSSHYQGRGFEGDPKYAWIIYSMVCMADSRDCVCNHHIHDWVENYTQYKKDPCHSPRMAQTVIENERQGMLKDSLVTCEWKSPNPGWENMECEMYNAVTGLHVTKSELNQIAEKAHLLYRAILMRNFDRTRELESVQGYQLMTYPDPYGDTVNWDEWNDAIDLYYQARGYDLQTGWPYRETWEKAGLKDVADEMEQLGKLPKKANSYTRMPNPVGR